MWIHRSATSHPHNGVTLLKATRAVDNAKLPCSFQSNLYCRLLHPAIQSRFRRTDRLCSNIMQWRIEQQISHEHEERPKDHNSLLFTTTLHDFNETVILLWCFAAVDLPKFGRNHNNTMNKWRTISKVSHSQSLHPSSNRNFLPLELPLKNTHCKLLRKQITKGQNATARRERIPIVSFRWDLILPCEIKVLERARFALLIVSTTKNITVILASFLMKWVWLGREPDQSLQGIYMLFPTHDGD